MNRRIKTCKNDSERGPDMELLKIRCRQRSKAWISKGIWLSECWIDIQTTRRPQLSAINK